jgi:hypothetical protein
MAGETRVRKLYMRALKEDGLVKGMRRAAESAAKLVVPSVSREVAVPVALCCLVQELEILETSDAPQLVRKVFP